MILNNLEKTLIKYFLLSKNVSVDNDDLFFADLPIRERDLTKVGFFTHLGQSEKLKVSDDNETYIFSKLGAKINHSIETGYLVFVKNGYIDCIEGFTYQEPWPENVEHIKPYTI